MIPRYNPIFKFLSRTCFLWLVPASAFAQSTGVKGTVVSSEDRLPVIGATVTNDEGQVLAVTDDKGSFVLNHLSPSVKTLKISYVGLGTITMAVSPDMQIVMTPSFNTLNEVMVVAYGKNKKNEYTGDAESVETSSWNQLPAASFDHLLQGQVAGLQVTSLSGQPGAVPQITLRGVGSISASSQPLYVLDGVPVSTDILSQVINADYGTSANPLTFLNPADIESVTVLKDAAAAALYGSRAANGVIMVTTHKGKKGQGRVNLNAKWGVSQLPSGGYNLMNADQHYKLYYQSYYNKALQELGDASQASASANQNVQHLYGFNPYNVQNPLVGEGTLAAGAKLMVNTDYMDELYRSAFSQQYDLNVSGGSDEVDYYLSLGYLNKEGIALASDLERYSGLLNLNARVKPWMDLGLNGTFAKGQQNTPAAGARAASTLTHALYMPNAVPIYALDNYFNKTYSAEGEVLYNWNNPVYMGYNALALSKLDLFQSDNHNVRVNPYIRLHYKNLEWKTTVGYDYTALDEQRWYNTKYGSNQGSGLLSKYAVKNSSSTLSSILSYRFTVDDVHHVSLMAGYEAWEQTTKMMMAQTSGYTDDTMIELSMGSVLQKGQSSTNSEALLSWLGQAQYDYNNRYYVSLSLRRDGSSRFAQGHRWGTFGSVALAWRLNHEDFMKDVEWVDDLKLRASYGSSGNKQSNYLYGYQGLFEGGYIYGGLNAVTHTQVPNELLSWEKSKNFELGVDFSVLHRLSGSLSYYYKKPSDLLLEKPLALSTGFKNSIANVGCMVNKGVELSLHSLNVKKGLFKWNTDLNLAYNHNKITDYPQRQDIVGNSIHTKGYSLYEFYMKEWAGVNPETGEPQWYMDQTDENGVTTRTTTSDYTKASKYHLGSAIPKVIGGMTNTFTYGDWNLSFLMTCSLGGKVYDGYEAVLMSDGAKMGYQCIKEQADVWSVSNPYASCPAFLPGNTSKSNEASSRYLHRSDVIKLKNVMLGYTLPKKCLRTIGLQMARLFVNIDNVAVWNLDSSFKGYDASQGGYSGDLDGKGVVPNPITFTAGVNVSF